MSTTRVATHLDISGLRGFAANERLELAIPNGKIGSGLTIVVGQNNAGKSTIAEAFAAVAGRPYVIRHFPEGKRNKAAGDRVSVALSFSSGYQLSAKPSNPVAARRSLRLQTSTSIYLT